MADSVQGIMEGMAVELNLLAKGGIFTKNEIRSIVRHRERFEFRVHRPRPSKLDYLRYIQYEQKLEQLRSRRLKRLNKIVNPMIVGGGVRHIHFIYERALNKFPTDLALWGSYVGFCRSCGALRSISNALGRALCAMPNEPRLWIFAANWEFRTNTNIRNARSILQRAIRINPDERDLYVEYARLELSILAKARERLGAAKAKAKIKSKNDDNNNSNNKAKIDEQTENGTDEEEEKEANRKVDDEDISAADVSDDAIDEQTGAANVDSNSNSNGDVPMESIELDTLLVPTDATKKLDKELGLDRVKHEEGSAYMGGEVPRLIFAQAAKRLPGDLSLRAAFVRLLEEFGLATEAADNLLRDELIRDLTAHFPDSVDAQSLLLTLTPPATEADKEASLEAVVRRAPTKDAWEKLILLTAASSSSLPMSADAAKRVTSLCAEADAAHCATERVYELWLTLAASVLAAADPGLAAAVAQRAVDGCPASPKLWRARVALMEHGGASSDEVCAVLEKAAASVEGERVKYPFWVDIVRRRIDRDNYSLAEAMRVATAAVEALCAIRVAESGDAGAFAANCYEMFRKKFARAGARKVAALFLKKTPCCGSEAFCNAVLDAEEPARDVAYVRAFYRVVLAPTCLGKTSAALWTRYHSFEQSLGNMREAANVYQRARATLINPSVFLDSFSGL